MPVDWKALEGNVGPGDYTIGDASGRTKVEKADIWRDFFKEGYTLR
jgi:DNA primase